MKRTALATAADLLLSAISSAAAAGEATVFKTATCECCNKWLSYMEGKGYNLAPKTVGQSELMRLKARFGLRQEQASCHTALIDGYVVEGHVPAEDVDRLLKERPEAIGLTVPGMPIGSPGMEIGDRKDAYDVLLIRKDGSTEVFAQH